MASTSQDHSRGHGHGHGGWARLRAVLRPHSHDAAESTDAALEGSAQGIRAVQVSLAVLGLTAAAQLAIQAEFSGWELAQVKLFPDGTRQVMLRRNVGASPQPGLSI